MQKHFLALWILLFLAGCQQDISVWMENRAQKFSIESKTQLTADPTFTLEWSKSAQADSYEVLIARDGDCKEQIFKRDNIHENRLVLDSLADGQYYLCVFAIFGSRSLPSSNNSFSLIVDRTAPVVTVSTDVKVFAEAFEPAMDITDMTKVTVSWMQLTGVGKVSFDDANAQFPRVQADQNGIYKIKATITDQLGHISEQTYQFYWEGDLSNVTKFVALTLSGVAADGFVNNSEKSSGQPLWSLSQKNAASIHYTIPLADASGQLNCDASKSYAQDTIPRAIDLSADGIWVVCVELKDTGTKVVYGKSEAVTRDILPPILTALSVTQAASDGYINASERFLVSPLWALSGVGFASQVFTVALDDTGGSVICDAAQNYTLAASPIPSSLSADGPYAACVKLIDAAGNISFGKSDPLIRDIGAPTFTSLIAANEASDGIITASEKNSGLALFALISSGASLTEYSAALADVAGTLNCDSSKTYGSTTIPTIASVATDGTFVVCVRLQDAASNITYGKSLSVLRDTTAPTVTVTALTTTDISPALAGTVNDSAATLSLIVNGQTYSPVNNGDGTWTLANNTIATLANGTYNIQIQATDAVGNVGSDATTNELVISAQSFITSWKTDNPGTSAANQITLPLVSGGIYDFVVDWGDSQSDLIRAYNDSHVTHTYAGAGTYTVTIRGTIKGWHFNRGFDRRKILNISQWGPLNLQNGGNNFEDCSNLTVTATDILDLTGATRLDGLFGSCVQLTTVPNMNLWNVSAITNMRYMFVGATNFNQPLAEWDVSHVTNMEHMFDGNANFNQPLNSWNVSAVTNMEGMFAAASSFNQNLNSWVTSLVTNMKFIFLNATAFNGTIGSWNTSNVLTMESAFNGASHFNKDLTLWNTGLVQSMAYMFRGATVFNGNVDNWNTGSVQTMFQMFFQASAFNRDVSTWNVSNVTNMESMFDSTAFNRSLLTWDVSHVTNMSYLFKNAHSFNGDISNWSVGTVTSMPCMFEGTAFNRNIGGWDVSHVTDMSWMFKNAASFNADLSLWHVGNVTSMVAMFESSAFNADISGWDTSKVTNMAYMFKSDTVFNADIGGWDVSKVTTMNSMFYNTTFNRNIGNWDVSHVTDMSSLFFVNRVFNADLHLWNVSAVTTMQNMFQGAWLMDENLSNWNVSNVTNMSGMFLDISNRNPNVVGWNVSNVTTMSQMFWNAWGFNRDISGWNTAALVTCDGMFAFANSFNANLGGWNMSGVTNADWMFHIVNSLSSANYDLILDGWASQSLHSGILFDGGNTKYLAGAGQTARNYLTATKGWIITDGGLGP